MRKRVILLLLTLTVISSALGCTNKQKTTIISDDVKQEVKMQESEVEQLITNGVDFLNKGKYDDAKSSFEKALSMDKANKGAYIEIKNRYMEKERLDDAYYFIKLAISNNVDTENMTKLLNDIKAKFEVTKINAEMYQYSVNNLPAKIEAKINNEDKEVSVVWSNNSVDTSKLGSIKYEGKIEQYDRTAELNLEIKEPDKVGYITGLYEENGKRYLKIDPAEFFMDTKNDYRATMEAKKDGVGESSFDRDSGRIYDSYYIRNKDKSIEVYELASNAEISVCIYMLNIDGPNSALLKEVSYEKLKTLDISNGTILCLMNLEGNVVTKLQQQYIP